MTKPFAWHKRFATSTSHLIQLQTLPTSAYLELSETARWLPCCALVHLSLSWSKSVSHVLKTRGVRSRPLHGIVVWWASKYANRRPHGRGDSQKLVYSLRMLLPIRPISGRLDAGKTKNSPSLDSIGETSSISDG